MRSFLTLLMVLTTIFGFETEFIKYEEEGTTAILTINRPKALNALNSQILQELDKTLDSIDTEKIRALIITGEGDKSFVAGADIAEMSTLTKEQAKQFSIKGNDVFRKIETFPIPVIAAVNGFALGGGCEISMSCDIRICSENAIFGQPEVGLGITPGFGGTQRLARLVGMGIAKQMIYTGQNIKSNEALRIGLVNAIYPQNELLNEAKKLASLIGKNGPNSIKNSKKAINEGMQVDMDKAIEIEEKYFGDCFETSEQKNGMNNFLNKNKKPKNLKQNDNKESKEVSELPKGELKSTGLFPRKMPLLTEALTIPAMPSILTAGDKNHYNSMTIGWGSIGVGFGRPIFTVYVKPERYTYQFIEKSQIFTVSYIDEKLYNKFIPYGTKSGKDINKEEESGTHIKFLDDGGITFEEAAEVFVCKIIAKQHITDKDIHQDIIDMYNNNKKVYFSTNPHVSYVGEIIGHYKKEK